MKHLKYILAVLALISFQSIQAAETVDEIKVGDVAPGFTLKNQDNQPVSLSDYKGKNIVLVFSRAHWCPFCQMQLVKLHTNKAKFDAMGVQVISVFREEKDGVAGAKKSSTKTGFSPILLDSPANITKAYSQGDYSTYLIGKDGKVKAKISGSKKIRPTADIILETAEKVFKP